MNTNTLSVQKADSVTTNRPAPLLPGFYSMQALSSCTGTPNFTQYHRKPEPAVKWMNAMAKKKIYKAFLLSSSESRWNVFNCAGKKTETRTTITPDSGVMMETLEPMVVDCSTYEQSVKGILGDSVCCLTFAVHHAYASSVGHSNMVVVARQLVMKVTEDDANHIYLADSVVSGCRVQGWFVDLAAVSTELMDMYLDRFKWLSKGWPLANDHHLQVLAYRMATLRPTQVVEILLIAGEHEYLGEHERLVAMRIQQTPPEKLVMFTAKMLEGLESAVLISGPQNTELLNRETLVMHAKRIAGLYRDTFLQ